MVIEERTGGVATLWAGAALLPAGLWLGRVGPDLGYGPVIATLPVLVGVLVVVLGARFRKSRLAVAALVVGSVAMVADARSGGGPGTLSLLATVAVFNLALLAAQGDHRIVSAGGGVQLAVVAVQVPIVALALGHGGGSTIGVIRELLARRPTAWAAVLTACLLLGVAFLVRRSTVEAAVLWATAACGLALLHAAGDPERDAVLAAGQLVLLTGLVEEAYRLAYHDQLTGLPGRRAFDDALRRLDGAYCVAMVDVDHFKRFNDRYGHDAGDQVLRMVAQELARVGAGGHAYRYGGEEFTLLFPGTGLEAARTAVEAVREGIARRAFVLRGADRPRKKPDRPRSSKSGRPRSAVTVSAGIAGPSARRPTPPDVLKSADRAMYRAKSSGRNRVVVTTR